MPTEAEQTKVLFIGGSGRSGSTLLDRVLGQFNGIVSTGELRNIWDSGFAPNQLCSCGAKLRQCEFWSAVICHEFGGFNHVNLEGIISLKHAVAERAHLPLLAFRQMRSRQYQSKLEAYCDVFSRLYSAIKQISGARVIVDSSSHPCHGLMLNEVRNVDCYIVHLVRDSRAVAYSRLRKKRRLGIYWKEEYMPQSSALEAAVKWDLANIFTEYLQCMNDRYLRIRYEDFIRNPQEQLGKIGEHLGEELSGLYLISGGAINLTQTHTALGNPSKFQRGQTELRLDNEWIESMRGTHKAIVTALTWPLLVRYGYLGDV